MSWSAGAVGDVDASGHRDELPDGTTTPRPPSAAEPDASPPTDVDPASAP
ncbi:hypothetical protein [Cellulosimicrobium sp. CUA-896]|nr:hypothetical protein [Cellulosimicrobium sp. CUA-896]